MDKQDARGISLLAGYSGNSFSYWMIKVEQEEMIWVY